MSIFSIFPWTRAYRAKKIAWESDFGRRYGWFVERDGKRIGELDYIQFDGQPWHEYSIKWMNEEESRIEADQEAWVLNKIVLRNRRYPDVVMSTFLTSPVTKGVIAVRTAFVPVKRFERDKTI